MKECPERNQLKMSWRINAKRKELTGRVGTIGLSGRNAKENSRR